MSPSRERTKGARTRRTKEQLLQELEITQRLLIEKEEELVLCQEELAHIIQDRNESARDIFESAETSERSEIENKIKLETSITLASSKEERNQQHKPPTHHPVPNVPIKIAPFTEVIRQNEPFSASILIDMTSLSKTATTRLTCKTKLFAKRLSDGWSCLIGAGSVFYEGLTSETTQLEDLVLPEGIYQLQAIASFSSAEGNPMPIAAIHEGEILQVAG